MKPTRAHKQCKHIRHTFEGRVTDVPNPLSFFRLPIRLPQYTMRTPTFVQRVQKSLGHELSLSKLF